MRHTEHTVNQGFSLWRNKFTPCIIWIHSFLPCSFSWRDRPLGRVNHHPILKWLISCHCITLGLPFLEIKLPRFHKCSESDGLINIDGQLHDSTDFHRTTEDALIHRHTAFINESTAGINRGKNPHSCVPRSRIDKTPCGWLTPPFSNYVRATATPDFFRPDCSCCLMTNATMPGIVCTYNTVSYRKAL